jgi:REP element-mobilizing transposase RayT
VKENESRERHSIRLKRYDYSQPGAYFVTMCVRGKRCELGEIEGEEIYLSDIGNIIEDCWLSLDTLHAYLELDEWKIMPNHMHGIVIFHEGCRGGSRTALTKHIKRKPLGRILGAFKTMSTKRINLLLNTPGKQFWQRG